MSHLMMNLNNHLLCAVDTETSGLIAGHHDILQVAIIPLTADITPRKDVVPFVMEMKPKRPENVDPEALNINKLKLCDIMTNGLDPWKGADLLLEWFDKLRLPQYKRIIPLGCNWPFDRGFIIDWLGPATYDLIFDSRYRDVQAAANYCNDIAGWRGNDFPYVHIHLGYLCTTFRIQRMARHDALDDARCTAEVYRRMIKAHI